MGGFIGGVCDSLSRTYHLPSYITILLLYYSGGTPCPGDQQGGPSEGPYSTPEVLIWNFMETEAGFGSTPLDGNNVTVTFPAKTR